MKTENGEEREASPGFHSAAVVSEELRRVGGSLPGERWDDTALHGGHPQL